MTFNGIIAIALLSLAFGAVGHAIIQLAAFVAVQ
jgi:hypothetical protein